MHSFLYIQLFSSLIADWSVKNMNPEVTPFGDPEVTPFGESSDASVSLKKEKSTIEIHHILNRL